MEKNLNISTLKTYGRTWFLLTITTLLLVTPLVAQGLQANGDTHTNNGISLGLLFLFAWLVSLRIRNIGYNPWIGVLAIFPWLCLFPIVMGLVLPKGFRESKSFKILEWLILASSIVAIIHLVNWDMSIYYETGGTVIYSFSYYQFVTSFL